jgi:S-adenosylmethionine:tRNA ribosyltransferase-isomerase
MRLDDFDYELPEGLIAQQPARRRDGSRLLHLDADRPEHRAFTDFPSLLRPGDLLVLNDTRVIKARLHGEKDSGGRAEILVERIESDTEALCQVRVSKPLQPGREVCRGTCPAGEARSGEFYRLAFPGSVTAVLEAAGEVPLPPYIGREAMTSDLERYQTVYGDRPGRRGRSHRGVALHRRHAGCAAGGGRRGGAVTLHVGAGTFQPVRVSDLADHRMHVSATRSPGRPALRSAAAEPGGRVVAVGTTVVRTLESSVCGDGVAAGRARQTCSSPPASDSRWWTRCSPTSTCRVRPC